MRFAAGSEAAARGRRSRGFGGGARGLGRETARLRVGSGVQPERKTFSLLRSYVVYVCVS